MKFNHVSIQKISYLEPEKYLTSLSIGQQLEPTLSKFGMSPESIEALTGIKKRGIYPSNWHIHDIATRVGKKVLLESAINTDEIGILINCSVSKDYVEPSVASFVHHYLGLSNNCLNFDLSNACLGFLDAITIIGNMIESNKIRFGLIVAAENSLPYLENTIKILEKPDISLEEYRKNFATLSLGSGACAMILGAKNNHEPSLDVIGMTSHASTENHSLCIGKKWEMHTQATEMLKAGIECGLKAYQKACIELQWNTKNFDHYAMHQVSKNHTQKAANILGVDTEKIYNLVENYGNVGPISIPIVLSKLLNEELVKNNDRIGLLGYGSGINSVMMEIINNSL